MSLSDLQCLFDRQRRVLQRLQTTESHGRASLELPSALAQHFKQKRQKVWLKIRSKVFPDSLGDACWNAWTHPPCTLFIEACFISLSHMTCCKCCFSSHTEKKWTRPPPSMLLQSQLKYLFKLQFTAIYKSSPYHWSPRASTPVSSLSEEKLSHGSLRTRLFNSSLHFLTKGNILILSLIPQDFKKKTTSWSPRC